MRYFLPLALFTVVACVCTALAQITTSVSGPVLLNTLMITTVNGQGTAFTLDIDGRQYLITARHIVENMGPEGEIKIAKFDRPEHTVDDSYRMKIFRCEGKTDIAVLIPPVRLTTADTMVPGGFQLGQNVYFVGFPFGKYSEFDKDGAPAFPRPWGLIRQGLLSGIQNEDGAQLLILDGMNLGGFSGSPVVYWVPANGTESAQNYVIGVVSGFNWSSGPVLAPRLIKEQDIRPGDYENGLIITLPDHPGKLYRLEERKSNGVKTNEMVKLNTGIVRSYHINAAIELIHHHPIGVEAH